MPLNRSSSLDDAKEGFIRFDRKTPGANVQLKILPLDFEPSEYDVLCGRGRKCKMWKGNVHYRTLVAQRLDDYAEARTKIEKGAILGEIIDRVRELSPNGGFVRKDSKLNRWVEVGDFLAREKTSQYFRDALHEHYASSAAAKYNKKKRQEAKRIGSQAKLLTELSRNSVSSEIRLLAGRHSSLQAQQYNDLTSIPQRSTDNDAAALLQQLAATNNSDKITVCALQLKRRGDRESMLDAAQRAVSLMEKAYREQEVDLFVLPELAPVGYSVNTFERLLPSASAKIENLYAKIDELFAMHAQQLGAYVCYGTIGRGGETPTIRQVVVDRHGAFVAHYDKMYLCNDTVGLQESVIFSPGHHVVSFPVGGFRCGLLLGDDIYYPELCRTLARDHHVDVLLHPSAMTTSKARSWRSLRESRAVENSVYVVAVDYAGVGETIITPPWVDSSHEPVTLSASRGYLFGRVEREALTWVRTTWPFYRHMIGQRSLGNEELAAISTNPATDANKGLM